MYFDGWQSVVRVLVVGTLAYAGLVLLLRISGKRTLSKMNAFDLVVTVALGSTLSATLLSRDVALVDGLIAFGLLIGLQYALTWTSVRSKAVHRLVKASPRLLAYRGERIDDALRSERVSDEELHAAIRDHGLPNVDAVYAVVLETDGSITVVPRHEDVERYGALEHVRGVEARREEIG